MARIRTIKPQFWDSPGTARASLRARLFFIAMWNWADDWGVGVASPKQLIAFAFPNDDDVTAADFPTLAQEVSECFDVMFYRVGGRPFYAIPSWDEHQRTERKSKRTNPGPDEAEIVDFMRNEVVASEFPTLTAEIQTSEREKEREMEKEVERGTIVQKSENPHFEHFWDVWPKRVAKADARRAWEKAVKKDDPEVIIAAAAEYAASPFRPEMKFIPLPATWLNGERWLDDPPQPSLQVTKAQRNLSTVAYFEQADRLAVEA